MKPGSDSSNTWMEPPETVGDNYSFFQKLSQHSSPDNHEHSWQRFREGEGRSANRDPHPLSVGSARPNPKQGAPDTENPSHMCMYIYIYIEIVLGGGLRQWSQTTVSEWARRWGRGSSDRRDLDRVTQRG